jgi:hypothetical protein
MLVEVFVHVRQFFVTRVQRLEGSMIESTLGDDFE